MLSPADAGAIQDAARAIATLDMTAATMAAATLVAAVSSTSLPIAEPVAVQTSTTSTSSPDQGDSQGECQLMGPFALIIQAALGGLALLSLVYKRWRERPQRPLKIWFFDVSKQVFGSVLVHIANIFMSLLTSGRFSVKIEPGATSRMMPRDEDQYVPNPCSFYLLNLAIDTTLGIPILILLLRVTTGLVAYTPLGKPAESIQSGHYGSPPNAWWWLKQSVIYFIGLFGMKICVLIIFLILPWISKVGDWALGWTEGNEKLQIAFVMMIFPLIMNAMQYYIIDSFIKSKENSDHERLPSEDPDDSRGAFGEEAQLGEELLTGTDLGSDDDDEDDVESTKNKKKYNKNNNKQSSHSRNAAEHEYDPDKDGEAPAVAPSSGSSSRDYSTSRIVQPELFPKE